MKAVVTDGRSIDEHIPRHLRNMFYKSSYPDYTYCTTNGYAPYDFSTEGLVFYAPLWALEGSPFKSVDAYKHICTVTTATWDPLGRTFNPATPDYIDCGRSTALDVGTGDFSIAVWSYCTDKTATSTVLGKGSSGAGAKRYYFHLLNTGTIYIDLDDNANPKTIQGGTDVADSTWHLIGFSADRSGNGVAYVDAVDDSGDWDISLCNASLDDTSKDFVVGVDSHDEATNPYAGTIGEVWLWKRSLSLADWQHLYSCTAFRYQ